MSKITNSILNNIFDKLESTDNNDLLLEYGKKRDHIIKQDVGKNNLVNNSVTQLFIDSLDSTVYNTNNTNNVSKSDNKIKCDYIQNSTRYNKIDITTFLFETHKIDIVENHKIYSQDIIDIIVLILAPESITYSNDILLKYTDKLRNILAFSLDSGMYYCNNKYKQYFNKSNGQSKIINNKHDNKLWFIRYLSDYFQINILLIIQKLVIQVNPYKNYPTLILGINPKGALKLYNSSNNSIHSASFGAKLIDAMDYTIFGWKSIYSYKVGELKQIFSALQLNTDKKKLNKVDIYNCINNLLGNL